MSKEGYGENADMDVCGKNLLLIPFVNLFGIGLARFCLKMTYTKLWFICFGMAWCMIV